MTTMNTQLQSVLDRLEGVKQTGSGYTALCPSHDDNRNSLSIQAGDDGRVLLHCFAECSVDDVCAGIELDMKDLFPPKLPSRQKRREVSHYDYMDESGKLLFQKVRYEPKDFRCRIPADAGGWTYKLNGVRRVLYRLPALIASPTIFICEGEKDCDLLAGHGYTATCNYDGAGKWNADYNQHFKCKRVYVLPDNDEPGRKHAANIYRQIKDIATDCRIVELPELPDKGDVSNWFGNGGTVEQLNILLMDAPEGLPESFAFTESTGSTTILSKPRQPFPVDCIPEPGQTLIRDIAESVNVDISFPAVAYLAVCAGLIGASRKVEIKRGWHEPSIIWAAIIGRPSSGKTPAVDAMMEALKPIEKRKIEAFDAELVKYESEKAARNKDELQPLKPVCKRTLISDITTEALCLRLKENPQGLLLYRDELAGWIGSFNQYKKSGSDEAHFLSIWSGKAVRVDRKTDAQFLYIENPNLSIVGGIQPGIMLRKLRGEHLDNGLAQRFLFAFPDDRVRGWTDKEISDSVIQSVQMVYETLLNLVDKNEPENQLVKLSSDARDIIRDYTDALAVEIDIAKDVTAEALGKMPAYLGRIALVLHELKNAEMELSFSETTPCITSETMSEAVKITNWFKDESIRVFNHFSDNIDNKSGGIQNPVHKQIEMWLQDRVDGSPVLAETLQAEAEKKCFSWVYVQRVAKEIGIKKSKSNQHGGKYVWTV